MLRIYILCTHENIFHPPMFYRILAMCSDSIIGAAIFPPLKSEKLYARIKRCVRIDRLWAIPRLAKHWLRHMKGCWFNSPPYYFKVENVFRHYGVPVDYFNNPNDKECIDRIKSLNVDIIFNNQPRILRADILAAPKIMCLNKHTSKLPDYRGIEPVFHALLNGSHEIGVSIHSVTPEIDAGDVYAQTTVPASKSVFDCYIRTFALGAELFCQAIENLKRGTPLVKVEAKTNKYYKQPSKEEILQFRKMGLTYL